MVQNKMLVSIPVNSPVASDALYLGSEADNESQF